jgi:hypothetical protein
MNLFDEIMSVYPDLDIEEFRPNGGRINLRNDADGAGDYIAKWDYDKPIPQGLKLGK